MTRYQKEAIAFSLLPLAVAILFYLLNSQKYIINFYDTYYAINSIYIALGALTATGYICYLIRCLFLKFRDKPSNIILLIYNILFIMLWSVLITFNERFSIAGGWTIYPPLSAVSQQKIETSYFIMKPVYMFILLALFIISLAFSAFKTGKKFNRINNEN
jgi:heme/copper-type cytochrome/quinol oxidase subunit 1